MKSSNPDNLQTQVARLLRAMASLIEKSDPDEVVALLKGQAKFQKSTTEKSGNPLGLLIPSSPAHDLPKLAETLHALNSRDEGLALLSSATLTRKDLERLGRIIGVPIQKSDNMERLTNRIIEASIGSRLSSSAIRGDHAK